MIEALAGISFPLAVLMCGVFMVVYVVFGGMLATTWVQIVKAGMLMIAGAWSASRCWPSSTSARPQMLDTRGGQAPRRHRAILGPGTYLTTPSSCISTGLTIFIGTAGLPHMLMRFFTVPDAKAARRSVRVDDRASSRCSPCW